MNSNFRNLLNTSPYSSSGYQNSSNQRFSSFYSLWGSDNNFLDSNQRYPFDNQRFVANSRTSSTRTPIGQRIRAPTHGLNYTHSSAATSVEQSIMMMCVTEGTGHSAQTIGMAAIDLFHPILELSQFTDNSNYELVRNKCIGLEPVVVILPKKLINEDNRLYQLISTELEQTFIKGLDRSLFNETEGADMIQKLRCEDCSSIEIQLKSKYYCLSACAALLKYLETMENLIYAPKSLRVVFKGSDNTMFIDPTTAKLLELIVNLNDPKSDQTLFGTINKTKTRSGYRLLRSNLLQPSTDKKLIESRLDMIEAIVSSQSLFDGLEALLVQFSGIEIDRVISCLVQSNKSPEPNVKEAERKIETILILKHVISLIDPIVETLSLCETTVFNQYLQVLSDERFAFIIMAINQLIKEDCKYSKSGHSMKLEKCSAIKKGMNGLLDIARDAYSESIDDIYYLVDAFRKQYRDLPLRVVYTASRGYHMEIVCKDDNKRQFRFPDEFIKIVYNKKSINFTTQELINKNNRINSSVEEIYLMSDAIITILIENIREFIGCLYNLSEVMSKIDLVFSFASQCSAANYVRPRFSDYVAVQQGRHPILEKVLNKKPVPNDVIISEDNNLMIITGPNMSGKSTLLKQVAIHQVMAQIGSYIPAEFATFRIFDKLFSRIGNNDEIETNSSTFMVEMREMNYILNNLSDSSLVIIDELGRGTSVEEGVGISFAICEHLLKTPAFTLIATHFIELTKLEDFYLNVSNYNFAVEHQSNEEETDSYIFTHILESGPTKEMFYGLRLANYTAMDPNILAKAQEFARILYTTQSPAIINGRHNQLKKIYYQLTSTLVTLLRDMDGQTPDSETLQQMQAHYRYQIDLSVQQTDQQLSDFSLF